jgi:copper/silver efflux system protein
LFSRITEFSIKNSNWILVFFALGTLAGLISLALCPLDAIPDLSDPQVLLYARVPGTPREVSQAATQPMMDRLAGLPEVETVRGFSDLDYSYITVVLKEKADNPETRQKIGDLARDFSDSLPVTWQVSQDNSGVGWVYEYSLFHGKGGMDLFGLRSLQEKVIGPALARLDGVAEVATVGGYSKQYQIVVNPYLLRAYGLTPMDLSLALEEPEKELKGRTLELNEREAILDFSGSLPPVKPGRIQFLAHGPINSPGDLAALKFRFKGREMALSQVATMRLEPDLSWGTADLDGKGEVVGGIVIARKGVNSLVLIRHIKEEMERLKPSFPGVEVQTVYDRSQLIHSTLTTVVWELFQELFLLSLVVTLFLGHYRSALVLGLAFPAALSLCFVPFHAAGLSLNLMTLGGLAIAIGDMLDAGIILVENANRRLAQAGRPALLKEGVRRKELKMACSSLMRPLAFTLLIVTVSFLPVFGLPGQLGRLFGPLAAAKTLGMLSALAVTLFLFPALCVKLLKGKFQREEQNKISMKLQSLYRPSLEWVLQRPRRVLALAFLLIALTLPLFLSLHREFLPSFNEGSLLFMPLTLPGADSETTKNWLVATDRRLATFPEVERVFGKAGRAESATDPAPLSMIESTVLLKPRSQWPFGMTEDKLAHEMNEALQFFGVSNGWTQPIRGRIDMQATGIRTPLGIKVTASTLEKAEAGAIDLEKVLVQISGVKSATAERVVKAPYLEVNVDATAAVKAGLSAEEVLGQVISFAGSAALGKTSNGPDGLPVAVIYSTEFTDSLDKLNRLPIFTSRGKTIPLEKLARVEWGEGPDMIPLENGKPTVIVYLDLDSTDILGWVERNRARIEQVFPQGSDLHLKISGQYQEAQRASDRLKWLAPLCLLLIAILLRLALASWREAGVILLSVPFAFLGGVWMQTLLGIPLSASTWVGYIALFAVAVQTGVVMVVYLKQALEGEGPGAGANLETFRQAVLRGSVLRLRPKLMTVATNVAAFLPLLWTQGAGGDLLASVAAPMVGGMITSAIHVLYITPVLFYSTRGMREGKFSPSGKASKGLLNG